MKTAPIKQLFLFIALMNIEIIGAIACRCYDIPSIIDSLKSSDIVFSGTVISKNSSKNYDSLEVTITGDTSEWLKRIKDFPVKIVKIQVDKVYKGKYSVDTLTILTNPNGASCGYHFEIGKKHIVYAFKTDQIYLSQNMERYSKDVNTFWTHSCTRTWLWSESEEAEILKFLK